MASQCTKCGQPGSAKRAVPFKVEHNGKHVIIQDSQTHCAACGLVSYVGNQVSEHELAVAAAIREMDDLLSAEALRNIRAKYRLRQTDLEQMLSVGPKTWTRWERGKIPQSKAADKLIRVIAEEPDVARRLMVEAGIQNEEATEVFAQIEENAKRMARVTFSKERESLYDLDPDQFASALVDKAFETVSTARRQAAAQAKAA